MMQFVTLVAAPHAFRAALPIRWLGVSSRFQLCLSWMWPDATSLSAWTIRYICLLYASTSETDSRSPCIFWLHFAFFYLLSLGEQMLKSTWAIVFCVNNNHQKSTELKQFLMIIIDSNNFTNPKEFMFWSLSPLFFHMFWWELLASDPAYAETSRFGGSIKLMGPRSSMLCCSFQHLFVGWSRKVTLCLRDANVVAKGCIGLQFRHILTYLHW